MVATKERPEAGLRVVDVSNADKVLFPDDRITKGDVINYYRKVAPFILRHVQGRPIMMQRYPDGLGTEGFYQKEVPDYFPDWMRRISVKKEGGNLTQVVCDDETALIYLANQACITIHTWLSRTEHIFKPDRMIFDLDPPRNNFELAKTVAFMFKEALQEVDLVPFVMTTGSVGLHVVVPLEGTEDFERVRAFSQSLARMVAEKNPDQVTLEARRGIREYRVYVDTLRNSYAQTAVAPYAIRCKRGAPVARPLPWAALENRRLSSTSFNLNNARDWLDGLDDPWENIAQSARPLKDAHTILKGMLAHSR